MKENSDGNDTNVGSIGNSIEDRINNAYCFLNSMHSDFRTGLYYKEDLENLEHILSDYKRVLKENEKKDELIERMKRFLLKENKMRDYLDYQESEEQMNEEEKKAIEEFRKQLRLAINIDDVTTAIRNDDAEAILNLIEKLQKENEELNNRCRNLDKEAQAYLEELAGDNTLTRRTIKQLQEENEELKKDYYNVINKIENKIDILDIVISECIYIDDDDKAYKKAVKKDKLCLLNQKRALQELLEGRE